MSVQTQGNGAVIVIMTVWELESLCLQKLEDEQLSVQERNAWQNALKSVEIQIELMTPKQLKLFDY